MPKFSHESVGPRRRGRAQSSLLGLLLRLLALLVIVQTTGAIHIASDLAGNPEVGCARHCEDDQDAPCPPNCATCLCSHGVRLGLPAAPRLLRAVPAPPAPLPIAGSSCGPHTAPDPAAIFHPPRG